MDNIPPFARKYVSKAYFDRLDWRERAAYLKGVQDVMDLFSKDLETRAMSVLKRKAHWLEPIDTIPSSPSIPVEYSSSRAALSQQSSSAAPAKAPTITTAAAVLASAKATAPATIVDNAKAVPKTWQASQQSTQSTSQPLKGSQSTSSPPNASQSQSSQSSTTSQPHLKRKATEAAPLDTEITFVGMRYRGGHVFSPKDQVRLERDSKNPVDKNAIKVMVFKNGTWIHAAYVGRDDAFALKDQLGIEHMKLTYLRAYLASVKYRLQA
ncbi:hypothetical protein BG015_006604 [Linnemannia schmuckeri]|uniref:HIRAN domain-containing protein n=1 Tax=Linnemannia schmuckeri TaxID=64567 RepID=A0A9P5S334_9FUNG|nr:hypothetical protein BG015_006604 [Linnemannia schmuckeri]